MNAEDPTGPSKKISLTPANVLLRGGARSQPVPLNPEP